MRKGEPLTDVRLLDSFRLPPGLVATPVRIADAAAAALIAPGATISVLAAWDGGQPARAIAEGVRVITIPPPAEHASAHGALVVLATTTSQATELAAAKAGGHLSITISPNLK
jgi:Flp pilus assembly protein CpaB